jgi:hypothetical protein
MPLQQNSFGFMRWESFGYGVEVKLWFPLTQPSRGKMSTNYKLKFYQAMNTLAGFKSVENQ